MLIINKIDRFKNSYDLIEKCEKLSKIRKLAKSRMKSSKNRNLPKFNTKKCTPSFLTPETKKTFNYLWLIFTKALILWYFNPKCHI